jgi:hypothetical protein
VVIYADTSFLFSLYAQDANTARAAVLAETLPSALIVTPLQRFELRNALRLSVFRRDITDVDGRRLLDLIEADVKTGGLVETAVSWADVYAKADALSAAHTGKAGARALDVLHVAAACSLGAREFYTFDVRQKALATHAGLTVRP